MKGPTTLALIALLAFLASAELPSDAEDRWPSPEIVKAMLIDRAAVHAAPIGLVLAIARCESGFRWWAVNPQSGATGVGQWLPPAGAGNAWDTTPAWREQRIDIFQLYRRGDPDAVWFDVDQFAWSLSQGVAHVRTHWSPCLP